MKRKMFSLLALLLAFTTSAAEFQLFRNGKPAAVIEQYQFTTPKDLAEKAAQDHFKGHISAFSRQTALCTGTQLPVVEKALPGQNRIIFHYVEKEPDQMDQFSWDFPDSRTMRIIATSSSIKFAFDQILEKNFGVVFLMHYPHWLKRPKGYDKDMEYIYPEKKNVSITMEKFSDGASFFCKRYFSGDIYKEWRVRPAYPGMHAMARQVFPASKYAADNSWPKSILPIINGKRYVMPKLKPADPKKKNNAYYMNVERYLPYMVYWQPCWSNPETVTIAAANIIELLEKQPIDHYRQKRYNINMDMSDNGGCCECDKCRAAVKGKYGKIGGLNYSELYWKWVNNVAGIVCKKYPDIKFNCLAYREVTMPPSFKLHPNVIPQIARELAGPAVSPEEKKNTEQLFIDWADRAKTVFLWDYAYGSKYYVFPRIYFDLQAEMMRMAYKYKVRGIYCEGQDRIGMEGPKFYLMAKLMWNINADINTLLKEWCRHAVGPEAAPYLEQYYRFWEQYWKRPEIRKTKWFYSASNIYMTLGESGSYTYAIRKGELAQLHKLLKTVIEKARTPMEKKRAKHFMRLFKISENAAKCLYSEYIQPNGAVANAADAAALLRSVPEAVKALAYLEKEPLITLPEVNSYMLKPLKTGICNFSSISDFLKDPAVTKELGKLMNNPEIPIEIRAQAKIMSGIKFRNRMDNGSFENTADLSWNFYKRGKLDGTHVSDGKWAVYGINPLIRMTQKTGLTYGKKYMLLVDVYAEKESAEGEAFLLTNPITRENRNCNYILLSKIKLNKGWQTLSNTIHLHGNRDGLQAEYFRLQFWCQKFEKDEPVWIDNVRLYQLD
ncbi:MAG: DUF4838 domain-containing protein [Lentisphaeria bacterium]|nr:DUF4838 domain-containing protein [Lentisphaeria bacterium]